MLQYPIDTARGNREHPILNALDPSVFLEIPYVEFHVLFRTAQETLKVVHPDARTIGVVAPGGVQQGEDCLTDAAIRRNPVRGRLLVEDAPPRLLLLLIADIILRATVRVGEHSERLDELLELFRVPALRVVGMVPFGQVTVDALDGLQVGAVGDLQHLVVVYRGRNGHGTVRNRARGDSELHRGNEVSALKERASICTGRDRLTP